ncbi:hypothetical protein BaRGS_00012485 [Batillaria attramentaria]|uniref:Uncharacterized protein n=1 Tax=Batillaria attramentaria TaxID=370345 RepID=A0ABD0LAE8_9CAEN
MVIRATHPLPLHTPPSLTEMVTPSAPLPVTPSTPGLPSLKWSPRPPHLPPQAFPHRNGHLAHSAPRYTFHPRPSLTEMVTSLTPLPVTPSTPGLPSLKRSPRSLRSPLHLPPQAFPH